jgi:hypothetical protein
MRRRRVARLRWKTYICSQKAFDEVTRRIVGDVGREHTLVIYGDANIGSTFGGGRSTPTTTLHKRITQRCHVVRQDEFRTSKNCCSCYQQLHRVAYPRNKPDDEEGSHHFTYPHSVRRCTNNECYRMVWNRDVNAAINILSLWLLGYVGDPIPKRFIRGGI